MDTRFWVNVMLVSITVVIFIISRMQRKKNHNFLGLLFFFCIITMLINFKSPTLIINFFSGDTQPTDMGATISSIASLLIDAVLLFFEAQKFNNDIKAIRNCEINFEELEIVDGGVINSSYDRNITIRIKEPASIINSKYDIFVEKLSLFLCLDNHTKLTVPKSYDAIKNLEFYQFFIREIFSDDKQSNSYQTTKEKDTLLLSFSFDTQTKSICDVLNTSKYFFEDTNNLILFIEYRILHKLEKAIYEKTTSKNIKKLILLNSKKQTLQYKFERSAQSSEIIFTK